MTANVIQFPCKARVAANDSNPWLSAEPVSPPEPDAEPPVYVTPYEEKPERRPGIFAILVGAWLMLFGII